MKEGGRKKPISKKVQTLIDSLQRRRGVRNSAKRLLVVCEDSKSAPNYFKALKKRFSLDASSIEVAHSNNRTQPIQVVERAIEIADDARRRKNGTVPFDEVWCVIDGDYGNKIVSARLKAKAKKIQLAVSTMCFEYWVLLHFEENDKAACDCDGHIKRLKKHIPDYEKGKCDFLPIVAHVRDACQRAEKLRQPGIQRGDPPENQNPCSEVYLLVNALGDAIR
jgi:hypothetical protein